MTATATISGSRYPVNPAGRGGRAKSACGLLSAHVLGTGTDFKHGVARPAVIQPVALAGVFAVLRVVIPLLPAPRPRAAVRG
jgi:hypothetical protein